MLTTYEEIISKYKKLYKYLQYHVLFILYICRDMIELFIKIF